eukprot:CAMPEP_0115393788 /NCGR_PEP_ID=MMETSP0271-20121206/11932_1 /TAXON_ID=71861 /ORGANISM="Scrippsiella trochoidea, Strain CCMP3099" /LENGTH=119 /DNA_ID=CAMNT_0002817441 /DNA_START=61 /DNA_END=417 /DNA_ORIENTATION=+
MFSSACDVKAFVNADAAATWMEIFALLAWEAQVESCKASRVDLLLDRSMCEPGPPASACTTLSMPVSPPSDFALASKLSTASVLHATEDHAVLSDDVTHGVPTELARIVKSKSLLLQKL